MRHRSPRPPADVPLERRERVLAGAGDAWASERALLLRGPEGWTRLPWWQVLAAEWDDERGALRVRTERDAYEVALPEPGLLPEAVRERVQASIVLSRHVAVQGRTGARIVARQVPGRSDLVWQVVPDPGLDVDDPRVAVALARERDDLRATAL